MLKFMSFNRDRVEDRVLCILAVPSTTLFWRETSDVVPGICLGVTAPNAFIGVRRGPEASTRKWTQGQTQKQTAIRFYRLYCKHRDEK